MTRRTAAAVALVLALVTATVGCGADGPRSTAAPAAGGRGPGDCDWPMGGHDLERTSSNPCPSSLSPDTASQLEQQWFFNSRDVVTATPVVAGDTAYVGDWSGRFYALDAETGTARWTFDAPTEPNVYAGQIVAAAAVDTTGVDATGVEGGGGSPTVVFASGRTVYALAADTGAPRWSHPLGNDDGGDFTEIQSSPVVAEGKVVVGYDVHNQPQRAGVIALDLRSGEPVWSFDPDQGGSPTGCADVWSSPSVDIDRRLVFFGTANCPTSPAGWGPYTEALVAVDLATGEARWSYQPHQPNRDDLDFAGAPNLFEADGRALVGLGNKDGTYVAVDRETGNSVWTATATGPGLTEKGGNFSTGGFIGPTAYAEGIIVGGTAVGPAPYLHAIDAASGDIVWQQNRTEATYAGAAVSNGVVVIGGNDFTLRALDLESGDVLWEHPMGGAVAGGAAIVGDHVFAVAGIREPGLETRSETSGVYRFGLPAEGSGSTTTPANPTGGTTGSTTPPGIAGLTLLPTEQACVDQPCDMGFALKSPPDGLHPTASLEITTQPFTATFRGSDLGTPEQWLVPGSPAAQAGAAVFGLFISESDDNPVGGLLCILDANDRCTTDTLPRRAPGYNRVTLLALRDAATPPTLADGYARLITTVSFEPPLEPEFG